jgi:hypothetical protein
VDKKIKVVLGGKSSRRRKLTNIYCGHFNKLRDFISAELNG